MRQIHLETSGGPATARLTIGQAHVAAFAMYIFEANKTTFKQIGNGVTPPSIQSVSMGSPSNLSGRFLTWDVVIAPFTSSGEPFSITLDILQNDKIVNSFTDNGTFAAGNAVKIHASAVVA